VRDIIDSRHSAEMRSRRGRCHYLARDLFRINSEMSTGEEIAGIADRETESRYFPPSPKIPSDEIEIPMMSLALSFESK